MSKVNNAVQIKHSLYSVTHLRDIYIGYMFSSTGYNLTDKVPPLVLGGNTQLSPIREVVHIGSQEKKCLPFKCIHRVPVFDIFQNSLNLYFI
jgi:hypothetical protein